MKKLLAALILLLLASPALATQTVHRHLEPETVVYQGLPSAVQSQFATNENIKTIKYGAGIALTSVTGRLATVALGAFIDAPSVDLRAYRTFKATFTEGAHTAVALIGEPGTAESLSGEFLRDPLFDDNTKWTPGAGWAVAGGLATATAANLTWLKDTGATAAVVGSLIKGVIVCDSITGGGFRLSVGSSTFDDENSLGTKTRYVTAPSAGAAFDGLYASSALTAVFSAMSIKRVTAPSALGALLYKLDGVTRSFESNNGLDANTAWVITIQRP
jgi:hypothetical protein